MGAKGPDRWRREPTVDRVSANSECGRHQRGRERGLRPAYESVFPMTPPTLRAWLRRLREEDLLAVVTRRVDPRFEMAAVTRRLDGRKAVWYERAGEAGVPVVAGVACTRWMLAAACGTNEMGLVGRLLEAEA